MPAPKNKCDLYELGACTECEEHPRFGCADLQRAFDAGKEYGAGRFAHLCSIEFNDGLSDMYGIWNEKNATEDEIRQELLRYPLNSDPRFLFIEKRTWDTIFGAPSGAPLQDDNDPFAWVKVANPALYRRAGQEKCERGVIVSVLQPAETRNGKGKITVFLDEYTVNVPFSGIGKVLFKEELQ